MSYVIQRSKDRKTWKDTGYSFAQRTNARRHMAVQKRLFPKFSYRVISDSKPTLASLEKAVVRAAMKWNTETGPVTTEELALNSACEALVKARKKLR